MVNALFTDLGSAVATGLHTAGAIAYLAGLVGFVSWSRHLHQGTHHARTLLLGQVLAYVGVLANLLGGFIRTYQPGHPSFFDFGASGWATVMVLKHAALFLGIGFAVYLFEMVAPRLLRTFKEHGSQALPQKAGRGSVWVVAVSIFLAAGLGAWTTVLPVGAADDGADDGLGGADGTGLGAATLMETTYRNFTGQLTSSAASPASSGGVFDLPEGVARLQADLIYDGTAAGLRLVLVAPDGTETSFDAISDAPGGLPAGAGGTVQGSQQDPAAGAWAYRVEADSAAGVDWDLSVRLTPLGDATMLLVDTVTIAPGTSQQAGPYEINTQMPLNGTLSWSWTTSAEVHFNVHSHFDGEVQDHLDLDADGHEGSYTNDREGGYSLYWTNPNPTPVTLEYRVWGDYTLDSIFPA